MKRRISYKTIKYLLLAALLLSLIPLLALGFFAVPVADDYSYGAYAHLAYAESGSLAAALSGALEKTVESYLNWQGTFSAIFLMSMQPAVFSEALYALNPFIMLAAYVLGSFMFCRAFFAKLPGLERDLGDIAAALLCLVSVQLMPSPVQGLYWFNGAVYYVFFHGLALAACSAALSLVRNGGVARCAALCLMCLVLGGGNYVTALALSVLAVAAMVLLVLKKDRGWKRLVLPAAILLISFAASIAAPGNAVRQAAQDNTPGVVKAVLMSFQSALAYGWEWMTFPVLGLLVALALIFRPALSKSEFSFPAPLLLSVFSFCLFSAMFCPPVYALGTVGEPRVLNIIYFSYLLLLALNLVYWLGWLCRRGKTAAAEDGVKVVGLGVAALLLALCCGVSMLGGTGFSSVGAVSTLASGEAGAYRDSALRRFELLKDESLDDVQLEDFPVKPYLLYFDDITRDPADWRNEDISTFYGKNSVVLK